ncbi:MAG: hypothetical protein IT184_14860 [Acidobacteria bacterium]|nr:hypothetical protein [Acidobacteriota bacterium]
MKSASATTVDVSTSEPVRRGRSLAALARPTAILLNVVLVGGPSSGG